MNDSLISLNCWMNRLTELDVSKCVFLEELFCVSNRLTDLNVTGCVALEHLLCGRNSLTSLDLTSNRMLTELRCPLNELSSLDVSNCDSLNILDCSENMLTSLNASGAVGLKSLRCESNQLTSLDLSKFAALGGLDCSNNLFTTLDVSNNSLLGSLYIESMPTLKGVCVWTLPFPTRDLWLGMEGSPNVCFKTDCSGECPGVGLQELEHSEISIYPNPVGNFLTIETVEPVPRSIEINSLNGQQLSVERMEGTTHQIDLSSFQKGIYFITIRSTDYVTTSKIIKL